MNKEAFIRGYMHKEAKNVLLIHGWNRGSEVFDTLAKKLAARGHTVKALDYPSNTLSATELAEKYIKPFLKKNKGDIVAHSAGGMLTRIAGQDPKLLRNRRTVMVAPALGGSFLAMLKRIVDKLPFIGKKTAPLLKDLTPWSGATKDMKPLAGEIGVITGTGSPLKSTKDKIKSVLISIMGGKNDDVVAAKHSILPEAKSTVEVPYGHTDMLKKEDVAGKIDDFITKGRF